MRRVRSHAVAQRLRGLELPALSLVAATGYGQDTDRERAKAAGVDAYLVKPVDFEILEEMMNRFTGACAPPRAP